MRHSASNVPCVKARGLAASQSDLKAEGLTAAGLTAAGLTAAGLTAAGLTAAGLPSLH
jgi:hypothetical protein